MKRVIAAVIAGSVFGAPPLALAQDSKAPEESTNAKNPDEIICKVRKQSTTRFPKKQCHTRKKWEELARQAQSDTEEMRGSGIDITRGN